MPSRSFLERYRAGEHVAVWDDLVALGKGVRQPRYFADAVAVADETMRRARHNVELIIRRLDDAGYLFIPPAIGDGTVLRAGTHPKSIAAAIVAAARNTPPLENRNVFDPPGSETAQGLRKLEEESGGPLPISLRAWYEQVGGVSLLGSHAELCPEGEVTPDPLVVDPLRVVLEIIESFGDGGGEEIALWLAPDEYHKANFSGGEPYAITIPNASADALFENEWHNTTFVTYLRKAFEWGGFPGWERSKNPPRQALAKLTKGLLPL